MAEPTSEPILRFEGVSVAFDGTPALIDLSFQAVAGESRVILGAAGSCGEASGARRVGGKLSRW